MHFCDFQNFKTRRLLTSHAGAGQAVPGVEKGDVRLSSPERVWDSQSSIFFYGGLRKCTFFLLQPLRDFRRNPPKS